MTEEREETLMEEREEEREEALMEEREEALMEEREEKREETLMEKGEESTKELMDDMGGRKRRERPGARRRRLTMQVVLVLGASLAHLGLAVVAAWPNSAILDLRRHNTTIYGTAITLSPPQIDMLGSMVAMGNLPGTWAWGWLVAAWGRRRAMMLLLAPYSLAWGMVALAPGPTILIVGRVIHGVCIGATFVSASTYIIELPDTSIRGAVGCVPNLALNLGFVLTLAMSLALRWYEVAFVGLAIIVMQTFVLAFFLPESPSFLAIKGRTVEARRVLAKLRGPSADVDEEIAHILEENREKMKEPLLKVLRDPTILRSLATVITLFFVLNFCGLMVFLVNMTRIFQDTGSNLSSELASIVVFLVQMAGTIFACIYLDRVGRRVCLVFSLLMMTLCLVLMGFYQQCTDSSEEVSDEHFPVVNTTTTGEPQYDTDTWCGENTWIPLACLTLYMFTSSMGAGPVPSILSVEYFPTAVRAQLSGVCMVVGSGFNLAALQLFTPMQSALTPAGLYWFYAAISSLGIAFTLACVRETRGVAVG